MNQFHYALPQLNSNTSLNSLSSSNSSNSIKSLSNQQTQFNLYDSNFNSSQQLLTQNPNITTSSKQVHGLNSEEVRLYHILMNYRAQHGLPPVPISKCMNLVAKVHCIDQQIFNPLGKCSLHSWSNLGNWTPCCYTRDHKKAKCMWDKPSELTRYKGYGFEISTFSSGKMTPELAFHLWKNSPLHNDLILNKGVWKGKHFQAVGIGLSENYCNAWFGLEQDDS